jgi:baculoviral IAP repeat-containing protein 2/3
MNIEENRLNTFDEWPANAAVDATRIAKAGFYYTGCGLEVQCFICGTRIADWNYGDQAMVRHRLAEPTCPFVINSAATCNVPYIPVTVNDVQPTALSNSELNDVEDNPGTTQSSSTAVRNAELVQKYGTVPQRLQSFNDWPITSIVLPEELASAGFYYRGLADMVRDN